MIKLESIQIASPRVLDVAGRATESGIFKSPVGHADICPSGLTGDSVVNTKHHGGPDQAVYVYSAADYAWWEGGLGRSLEYGMFGENLTFSDFGEGDVMVGDRWGIGEVLLETTAPRIPCATFGAKMGDPEFPKRFRDARRPGFYARVIQPGTVITGMEVVRIPSTHEVSVIEVGDLFFDPAAGPDRLQRALSAPIAERAGVDLERRLERFELWPRD